MQILLLVCFHSCQRSVAFISPGTDAGSNWFDLSDVADTNLDEDVGRDNCIGDGKAAQLVQSVLNDMT